jgi:hypothetical protein
MQLEHNPIFPAESSQHFSFEYVSYSDHNSATGTQEGVRARPRVVEVFKACDDGEKGVFIWAKMRFLKDYYVIIVDVLSEVVAVQLEP